MLKQTPAESMLGLDVSTVTGYPKRIVNCGASTKKSLMPKAEKSRDRLVVSEKQINPRLDRDIRDPQMEMKDQRTFAEPIL